MKIIKLLVAFLIFSNFVVAQQNDFGRGLSFNDDAYAKVLMKAPLTRSLYGTSLPSSASLKEYCPTPKNQGNYGTCVGWSTTYAARTIVFAMQNNWTDKAKITANTFAPGFIYKLVKFVDDENCQQGTFIDEAFKKLKTMGVPKFSDFNINCPKTISADIYDKAKNYKIQDFARLFGTNDNNNFKIQAMKKSLSENKPVVIGMKCPSSFNNAVDVWQPIESCFDNFGGHAMCVIGYDDTKHGGAFEIQNSWGTGWGNEGYIWIKYDDFANFTKYAYELVSGFKPNTETVLSGNVKYVLSDGSEMQATLSGNSYKMAQAYKSGTRFRLYLSNNEPAYVYAFGSDLTQNTYQIFPHKPEISAILDYKQNDVAIPDEDHFVEMDNTVGTDYLCVLYSVDELNIDNIRKKVETGSGTFNQKVQNAVDNMIDFSNIQYSSGNQIGFKAKSANGNIVALIIEIKHVE